MTDADSESQQYAFSNIKAMESRVDVRITEWINKLDAQFVQPGKQFDFAPWTTFVLQQLDFSCHTERQSFLTACSIGTSPMTLSAK